ncbi:hypothetical protein [Vibrio sp. E14]|nr:hypothetical protein [Vibrio sp. E14]
MKQKLLVTLLGLSALGASSVFAANTNVDLAEGAYIYGYSIDLWLP